MLTSVLTGKNGNTNTQISPAKKINALLKERFGVSEQQIEFNALLHELEDSNGNKIGVGPILFLLSEHFKTHISNNDQSTLYKKNTHVSDLKRIFTCYAHGFKPDARANQVEDIYSRTLPELTLK